MDSSCKEEDLLDIKQVIVVRKDLNMRKGKMCAQAAHASNMFLFDCMGKLSFPAAEFDHKNIILDEWIKNGYKKVVCGCVVESELLLLIEAAKKMNLRCYPVYDFGLTEFHGQKTLTCASFGPAPSDLVNKVTGHLQLI